MAVVIDGSVLGKRLDEIFKKAWGETVRSRDHLHLPLERRSGKTSLAGAIVICRSSKDRGVDTLPALLR